MTLEDMKFTHEYWDGRKNNRLDMIQRQQVKCNDDDEKAGPIISVSVSCGSLSSLPPTQVCLQLKSASNCDSNQNEQRNQAS